MADHDTPGGRAEKRARIIAGQALREAAAPPVGRRGGRRRNHGPIWSTPAPVVAAETDEAPGASDEIVAVASEGGAVEKTVPRSAPSRGTPANKNWRS
jgi:hypothetical protein